MSTLASTSTPLYRLEAHKRREPKLTSIASRSIAFTNLTAEEARDIAEFLVDHPVSAIPGTQQHPLAAGSLEVTIAEIGEEQ